MIHIFTQIAFWSGCPCFLFLCFPPQKNLLAFWNELPVEDCADIVKKCDFFNYKNPKLSSKLNGDGDLGFHKDVVINQRKLMSKKNASDLN